MIHPIPPASGRYRLGDSGGDYDQILNDLKNAKNDLQRAINDFKPPVSSLRECHEATRAVLDQVNRLIDSNWPGSEDLIKVRDAAVVWVDSESDSRTRISQEHIQGAKDFLAALQKLGV